MEKRNLYVLDTSVLVHDPESIKKFRNTVVAIPIYVVMELDDLKDSKRQEVATNSRIVSRYISSLMANGSLHNPDGVLDPDTGSRVIVIGASPEEGGFEGLLRGLNTRQTDLLILKCAITKRNEGYDVVVITKDVNMRILADSEGLKAEDYRHDRVDPEIIPSGLHTFEYVPGIEENYQHPQAPSKFGFEGVGVNEFVLCGEHLFRLHADGELHRVPKTVRGGTIQPRNLEQRMAMDLLADNDIQLVCLSGIAGSGKTLLSLNAALDAIDRSYEKIILSKPVVPMGRELGFLPGSAEEKIAPWMLSYMDNLDQLFKPDDDVKGRKGSKEKSWEQLLVSKKIEIQPLHSIRGRSLANSYIILDETQNCNPHEVKTFVSRAAKGTKIVLCGDPSQIDDAYLDAYTNGLVHAMVAARGSEIAGSVTMRQGVRSALSEFAATRL